MGTAEEDPEDTERLKIKLRESESNPRARSNSEEPISVATSIRLTHGLNRTKKATTSAGDSNTVLVDHMRAQQAHTVFSPERAAKRRG